MKINKTIKILVFITLFALVIISCNKNEINPDNLSNGKSTAVFNSDLTYGTVVDRDGNEYKTIVIGTQTWMAENLRTTMYNDGSDIPLVTDNTEWSVLTTPAYCNYNNSTNLDTIGTYGRLYNGYAVSKDICPTGWHVPNGDDWAILMQSLTSEEFAGGKMKEAGTTHWYDPNYYANNESGFTALPAGWRVGGFFDYIGINTMFWSSEVDDFYDDVLFSKHLSYAWGECMESSADLKQGNSVRCVKD